jgi:hypothetical protein
MRIFILWKDYRSKLGGFHPKEINLKRNKIGSSLSYVDRGSYIIRTLFFSDRCSYFDYASSLRMNDVLWGSCTWCLWTENLIRDQCTTVLLLLGFFADGTDQPKWRAALIVRVESTEGSGAAFPPRPSDQISMMESHCSWATGRGTAVLHWDGQYIFYWL